MIPPPCRAIGTSKFRDMGGSIYLNGGAGRGKPDAVPIGERQREPCYDCRGTRRRVRSSGE
jgi:hypothetical protein